MMDSNRFVHRVIAMVMVITVLFSCVSVFAENEADIVADTFQEYNEQFIIYCIWQYLKSIGISITYVEAQGYVDSVNQYMLELIYEYLSDFPSIGGFAQWVFPWLLDITGEDLFVGNISFLNDMNDFVEWLVSQLSLTNDSSIIVKNGQLTIGGIYAYGFPYYAIQKSTNSNDGKTGEVRCIRSSSPDTYMVFLTEDNESPSYYNPIVLYSPTSNSTGSLRFYPTNGSGYTASTSVTKWLTSTTYDGILYEFTPGYSTRTIDLSWIYRDNANRYSQSEAYYALSGGNISSAGNVVLTTTTIIYPSGDSPFTFGDGNIVFVEYNFPEKVTVGNLPAVIARNDIQNPGIASIWHYVSDTIDNFDDGVNLMRGVIYSVVPSPYLLLAYAALVLLLVFGLIKVARK